MTLSSKIFLHVSDSTSEAGLKLSKAQLWNLICPIFFTVGTKSISTTAMSYLININHLAIASDMKSCLIISLQKYPKFKLQGMTHILAV